MNTSFETLTTIECRVLRILRDAGWKTASQVGVALWGKPKKPTARLCWPAGSLLRRLKSAGFVDREVFGTMFDYEWRWSITDAGRGFLRSIDTGNEIHTGAA